MTTKVSPALVFLQHMAKQGRGLIPFAQQCSARLGLEPLEMKSMPSLCKRILYPKNEDGTIQWDAVVSQINGIGELTGIAAVVSQMVLVFQGENGSVALALTDIQQRRHEGILRHLEAHHG